MSKMNRERTCPKRLMHAKGSGAFGYFVATANDLKKHCISKLFDVNNQKIRIMVRFSTAGDETSTADTLRDLRGFAVKFFTDEGEFDLVGSNIPVYFCRDPELLPSLITAQKRNPATQFKDVDANWDFLTTPEATHMATLLYSDRGIPDGYRYMNGYGVHTFKLVNAMKQIVYCKFHFKTDQGIKNLTSPQAFKILETDRDYAARDLYNAIQFGLFPGWDVCVQIMSLKDADSCRFDPFDPTKVWPHQDFPLIKVGQMVLDRNPKNYFEEIEIATFSPKRLIKGIEASPDQILQLRLTTYTEIPPDKEEPDHNNPENSNGSETHSNASSDDATEDVRREDLLDNDDFTQAGVFYRKVLDFEEKNRLVNNIVSQLLYTKHFIQDRAINNFSEADPDFGRRIQQQLEKVKKKRTVGLGSKLFLVGIETAFSLFQ